MKCTLYVWRQSAAESKGKLETAVLLVGPEMGGTLVVAGKYGVELVAKADGSVEAIVRDAAGARVNGDANVKLAANLAVEGGGTGGTAASSSQGDDAASDGGASGADCSGAAVGDEPPRAWAISSSTL